MFFIGNKIAIIDKETNKIIASGKISSLKERLLIEEPFLFFFKKEKFKKILCISFDDKYFFNVYSEKFIFKTDNNVKIFDIDNLKNYTYEKYNTVHKNFSDIYIEDNIFELDKEVIRIVNLLNKIPNITTTGSCCGHGLSHLWVSMTFKDLSSLRFLLNVLHNKFRKEFIIKGNNDRSQLVPNVVELTLISTKKGNNAYNDTEKLCDYIETCINTIFD